jgi:hypothetical protein
MTVSEILSYSVDEILKSRQLTLAILKIYSQLYLNGGAPRGCSKSIAGYYSQLRTSNVKEKDIIMEKTNKFKRLIYIASEGMHFSDANLTDEKAIQFLDANILSKNDFITLPEAYVNRKHPDIIDEPKTYESKTRVPVKHKTYKKNRK